MHNIHDQLFKGLAVAFPGDLVTLLMPEVAGGIPWAAGAVGLGPGRADAS
jgi:hypothetical protein